MSLHAGKLLLDANIVNFTLLGNGYFLFSYKYSWILFWGAIKLFAISENRLNIFHLAFKICYETNSPLRS